jgi:DNA-binding NarL/FixJ family response regulator
MRPESSAASSAALRIGIVDRRPVVRERLEAVLSSDPRLVIRGSFANWAAAAENRSDVDLWVSSEQGGGVVRRVSLEDHDVEAGTALCDAVRAAASDRQTSSSGPQEPALRMLSPHEYAVLESTADGLTAAQTAERLGVTVRSVETARRRAMAKLGAASAPEAVRLAHEMRGRGFALRAGVSQRRRADD